MKPERTDTQSNRELILDTLSDHVMTANECINQIFQADVKSLRVEERSWKFYVHLNKLFSPMEEMGLIEAIDTVTGPTNKPEKLWIRC